MCRAKEKEQDILVTTTKLRCIKMIKAPALIHY